jgi:hypothetical protein
MTGVDLFWLPLGAGGSCVRLNGRVYEAIAAAWQHRARGDLYHAALEVHTEDARFVIEMAPSPDAKTAGRGVVSEGPVGSRHVGRWRLFRYEIRRWRNGVIPDVDEAVGGRRCVSTSGVVANRMLTSVPDVPLLVWGRDEAGAHDMWNSNSLIAWLVTRAGIDAHGVTPPRGGRAPGWRAGIEVARRDVPANGGCAAPAHPVASVGCVSGSMTRGRHGS